MIARERRMGQSKPFQKDQMTKASGPGSGSLPSGRCPICKAATEHDFRPFCSSRCADADLGKWLTGSYAIPVDDSSGDSEDDGSDVAASKTTAAAQRRVVDDEDD
jgi:uncharacterized protein